MTAAKRQHHNLTLAVLISAGLAYALQQTMVVPALPGLQHDLHTTQGWVTWVLSGFLLSASVGTPLLGKLGDQYGKEKLLLVSLTIFLVGCIGAAAAWNIWSLIAFRALQGAAGAIFPLAFSIIRDEFPHERVGVAIGTLSAIFGIGGSVGLVLSGVLVDNLSWRWIFIVGAIPVVVSMVLVHRFVPASPVKTQSRVDVRGATLLSLGLLALLVPMTEGEAWGWSSARVLGLFALAVVLLAAWVVAELQVDDPMVQVRMLTRRPVLFTNATALISGLAMYSAFVLVPTFAQTPRQFPAGVAHLVHYGFGVSATKAGVYLVPGSLTMLFAGPLAGIVGRRFGSKWPLTSGMVLVSAGAAILAATSHRPWEIVVAMVVFSIGVALAFASMSTLITQAVEPTETGVANAMNTVLRTIGGVIGAQIAAAILAAHAIAGTGVPARSGFVVSFALFAGIAAAGALSGLLVTPLRRRA